MRFLCACLFFAIAKLHAVDVDFVDHVEFLYQYPEEKEKFPLLVYLHGANTMGAWTLEQEQFDYWNDRGIGVVAISLSGFGNTIGTRDYCGKSTMENLHNTIDAILKMPQFTRVGILGSGYGGIATKILIGQRRDLLFAVTTNSCCNLEQMHQAEHPLHKVIVERGIYGIDWCVEESALRSPSTYAKFVTTPLLMIHRTPHPHFSDDEVYAYKEAISPTPCKIVTLPYEGVQRVGWEDILRISTDWILDCFNP